MLQQVLPLESDHTIEGEWQELHQYLTQFQIAGIIVILATAIFCSAFWYQEPVVGSLFHGGVVMLVGSAVWALSRMLEPSSESQPQLSDFTGGTGATSTVREHKYGIYLIFSFVIISVPLVIFLFFWWDTPPNSSPVAQALIWHLGISVLGAVLVTAVSYYSWVKG